MTVLVVGAGLSGLATALWLMDHKIDVQILEANGHPGGRAQTLYGPSDILGDSSGQTCPVDAGTQYFHSTYRRALTLINRCGLSDDLYRIKGRTKIFDKRLANGSFTTGHRLPYMRSGSLWDNLRLTAHGLWLMTRYPIDPYALNTQSRADGIDALKVMTKPFERAFGLRVPAVAGTLVEPETDSLSILQLVRLLRIVVMSDYLGLTGGIASLHYALARMVEPCYHHPVTNLVHQDGQITGVQLEGGRVRPADHVVLAVPPSKATALLPISFVQERSFLESIHHPAALLVTLFLDHRLECGIWSYMFPSDPERLVSFCIDAAEKNPALHQETGSILQAWICHPASASVSGQSDGEIIRQVTDELSASFGSLATSVHAARVTRHMHAVPQHPPGHQAKARAFLASLDQRQGISVCGDYLSGGYMECALWSAETAVKRIVSMQDAKSG